MTCKWKVFCKQGDTCVAHNGYDILKCTAFKEKGAITNEEYLRSCNTEELAIFICNNLPQETEGTLENRFWNALYSQYPIEPMNAYHEVMKWLKEEHK